MTTPFTFLTRVRYGECDAQLVVFNARYGDYADLAATEYFRALFGGIQKLLERQLDTQVVHYGIDWKAPARFDDVLGVRVRTARTGTTSFALAMEFFNAATGALVMVNDDPALARSIGADGLHLTARSLASAAARPEFEWVGASCHTRADLEKAAGLELDYALLGAVQPTLSHPERNALGWPAFTEMIARLPLPVFALGGLGAGDLGCAKAAGAHGVAGIRAFWQS